jgi:hypothetical protein
MRWLRAGTVLALVPIAWLTVPARGLATSSIGLRAGVGVVDATWHVGAGSGQYSPSRYGAEDVVDGGAPTLDEAVTGSADPQLAATKQAPSYGVQSRLSIRAIVIEGNNGTRVALVKSDNYLAQDLLSRRVAQLLAGGASGVDYDHILYSASHNHASPDYATPAWGVWLFQDVMDLRMFEWQARRMAEAIERAAADLRPARVGATTVQYSATQRNAPGPAVADDGTPAGYPDEDNDHGLVVLRFDDTTDPANPRPLATWMNYGQHPESLDGYSLISADYLAPLERFVGRETGAPLVFSQGGVGSAEQPRADSEEVLADGTKRAFSHAGHAQVERGARLMADSVIAGWREIGAGGGRVPFTSDVPVESISWWVPGPISHPYPSVSNCRTEPTVEGNPGVPVLGLPDCERGGTADPTNMAWENLRAEGVALPEHYDAPAFTGVEENLRIHLQAVRLGEILLASCSCEAQSDLIRNLESRADKDPTTLFDGYDWTDRCDPIAAGWACTDPQARNDADRSLVISDERYRRMRAEVHNDAAGWDTDPTAGTEPADPDAIKGNFTKEQLPPALGYDLVVGLGHTGDYNGYTVSYREYMNRDHYRKALTSYGPHTADYMVTRLVRLGGHLKGGPLPAPEPLDALARADELRQEAVALALGAAASAAYEGWEATLPDDAGSPGAIAQPTSVTRFDAATFAWRGGDNWVDNPSVRVERLVDGEWQAFADQTGEVQTMVELPQGVVQAQIADRTATYDWRWTASFEAFDAFPARLGSTPSGQYRFVVDGQHRSAGRTSPYHLESSPFEVRPWEGIQAGDLRVEPDGSVSFAIAPILYPTTYTSPLRFVRLDPDYTAGRVSVCRTCSFRPWAEQGSVATATVTVYRATGGVELVAAVPTNDRWLADTRLATGDRAVIERGGVVDAYGELNGQPTDETLGTLAPAAMAASSPAGLGAKAPATAEPGPAISPIGAAAGGGAVAILLVLVALRSAHRKQRTNA